LTHIRKPPKASRGAKAIVSAEAHAALVQHADAFFKAFLQLLWLTGARPGEIASLTADAIDIAQGIALLAEHKTAHLGKSRIVFLSAEAVAILRERIAFHPEGLLFPSENAGGVMTAQAIGCRLRRLCIRAGVKHCIAYGYRHGFATDALAKGVPDAQVAALLGHSGTAMLHKHYSHLTGQARALREALGRVR
jgi:integrase